MSATTLEVRPQSNRTFMDDVASLLNEFGSGSLHPSERLESIHRDNQTDAEEGGARCEGCNTHKPLFAFDKDVVRGFKKFCTFRICKACRKAQRLARLQK